MLLNVVCFLSLGVCGWIVSLCSGCVGCCAFCLICDACSCKCWCIGSRTNVITYITNINSLCT